ncbi:hypothetical protein HanIR_Chr17g0870771 [Helianthus annuus]|nr:hypothetical protein HanIR_Chr17g0870771 [Helianthus annuus]
MTSSLIRFKCNQIKLKLDTVNIGVTPNNISNSETLLNESTSELISHLFHRSTPFAWRGCLRLFRLLRDGFR